MCVCMHGIYIHLIMSTYMCMCVCVCMHGEVKGQYWGSFLIDLHLTKKKKKEIKKKKTNVVAAITKTNLAWIISTKWQIPSMYNPCSWRSEVPF